MREDLAARLGERRVLIVLDNAEHLLDAAPDVSWLVATCPRVSVLVTSRAPLRVAGEEERLVEPLALPAATPTGPRALPLTAEEAGRSPAVSLFVTRARSVSRGFVLGDHNAAAVAELCRRLGGIPLAIELAAARIRVLDPDRMLERLDEALATGPRDLPPRQRTMQATLDWSYQLLSEPAQALFRSLSVFTGGWTLELLEDTLGPASLGPLEELVEHSLVSVERSFEGRPRYAMLEPILQHARRLATAEEGDRAARAHLAACVRLAERAAHGYLDAEQVRWLRVVDDEHANLLAAVEHSTTSGEHDGAARIVWALWLYWWFRGLSVLGRRAATTASSLPHASPRTRARATIALAAMAFAQGDHAAARDAWQQARDATAELGDVEAEAHSEAGLGIVRSPRATWPRPRRTSDGRSAWPRAWALTPTARGSSPSTTCGSARRSSRPATARTRWPTSTAATGSPRSAVTGSGRSSPCGGSRGPRPARTTRRPCATCARASASRGRSATSPTSRSSSTHSWSSSCAGATVLPTTSSAW